MRLQFIFFKAMIRRFFLKIKSAFQRMRYGYSDCDVWDIDVWFLNIMPKMLKQLKETTHSYPSEFASEKEWAAILERMIFLLHEMDEDRCMYENPYEEKWQEMIYGHQKCDEKLAKLYLGEERNKSHYMELCKQEFFNLFSKYFYNLWD